MLYGVENICNLLYPKFQISWLRHPSLYLFSKGVKTNQAHSWGVQLEVNIGSG